MIRWKNNTQPYNHGNKLKGKKELRQWEARLGSANSSSVLKTTNAFRFLSFLPLFLSFGTNYIRFDLLFCRLSADRLNHRKQIYRY
ncbi:hypothetical protein SDJN03_03301, partial [Cucurbita argyrosperma subsp. sororia]